MTPVSVVSNLPVPATTFIGREEDLAKLKQLLADPVCRLITLLGPGGIGKTRLAVHAAYEVMDDFVDGVYFVPLQTVTTADMLVAAIIDTVKLPLQGHDTPIAQLRRFFRDRALLLILDNFEQLVQHVDVLIDLLESAPRIRLLVTSREVLNLRQEWVLTITGMHFPDASAATVATESGESYGAVRLFVEFARRVRPDFALEDDLREVIQICQIVEGVPLAIELAASWLKALSCADIVRELQQSLAFLDTTIRDLPPRHRSIRAVFDHSWTLLSPQERRVFSRLAIFRGGFRREAAEQVAGASLLLLSALIDKSLIRIDDTGRYQIHEVLRQFAEAKLNETAGQPDSQQGPVIDENRRLQDRHCAYFAEFLRQHAHSSIGGSISSAAQRYNSAYAAMLEEADNIWAAWDHALGQGDERIIEPFLVPLYRWCDRQNRYYDGERIFRAAIAVLSGGHDGRQPGASPDGRFTLALARSYLCLALCLQNLTRYEEALKLVEAALPTLSEHNAHWELWNAEWCLANIAYSRGDYLRAGRHFEQVYATLTSSDDPAALVIVLSRLSDLAAVRGDYPAARAFLSEAVAKLETSGNERSRTRFLITLGDIEIKIGNYEKAAAHFEAALALSRELDNIMAQAIALVSLARVAYEVDDFARTETLCQASITLFDEVRHLWGKAFALVHMGRACVEMERFDDAYQHFTNATLIAESTDSQWLQAVCYLNQGRLHLLLGRRDSAFLDLRKALQIAADIHTDPLILDILGVVADAAALEGDEGWAHVLAACVARNPHTEAATRATATALLRSLHGKPLKPEPEALATLTPLVLSALSSGFAAVAPPVQDGGPQTRAAGELLDALTERELEILKLLAEGYTNQEIAEKLYLVLGTVKAHNHNIFSKLGVTNRVQAMTKARDLGLV